MGSHFVVSEKLHTAAKAVALRHKQDLGKWVESELAKNPEIQAEIKSKQVK